MLQLVEIFHTKNHTYIVTELCEGGDLNKLLKTQGSIQEPLAKEIFKGIIKGWIYIYEQGFLHRDLKPANILFN